MENVFKLLSSNCTLTYYKDMEDALTAILAMEEDKTASFFAVYDGHGGEKLCI